MAKNFEMSFVLGAALAANFADTFKRASEQVKTFQGTLNNLNAQQKKVTQAIELQKKLSAAGGSSKLRDGWEKDREALSKLEKEAGLAGKSMQQLMNMQKQLSLNARLTGLAGGAITAGRQRMTQNLGYVTAAGRAVYDQLFSGIGVGMNFDTAMSEVGAVSGLRGDDLRALREQAKTLGATTVWSASEAAQGQKYLAMAGFNRDQMLQAMPGMLSLATAGGIDLSRAADISSNILSGMGIQASEMDKVGDILVNTFTRSNTSLESLGETMKMAAPTAKDLGVSLEVASAMAGKLGDAGIQGSMAGTAMRSIMTRIVTNADTLKKELNINAIDAQGNLRELPEVFAEMSTAMAKMNQEARVNFLKGVFGERAMGAASILIDQAGTGELQTFVEGNRRRGSAAETATEMSNNLGGGVKGLQSAFEGLQIAIYETLGPTLIDLVKKFTEITQAVGKWAKENPELVEKLALVAGAIGSLTVASAPLFIALKTASFLFGGLQVGLGGLLWAVKPLILAMNGLKLAMMSNPLTIWITAIGAAIAAGYLLYKNWDTVKAKAAELWAAFSEKFPAIAAVVTQVYEGTIKPIIEGMKTTFNGLIEFVTGVFSGEWGKAWEGIKSIFAGIWQSLSGFVKAPINAIISAINKVIQGVNSFGSVKIPGLGDFGINLSEIPMLARGGIATAPTLAMVGEGRENEAILPLSALRSIMSGDAASFGISSPVTLNLTVNVEGSDSPESSILSASREAGDSLKRELERILADERRLAF